MKKLKKIPKFKNEKQEKEFWSKNDSVDYIDWSKARSDFKFSNLKPSTETISLRLSKSMLNELKTIANEKDVPYQSFIKIILDERIKNEIKRKSVRHSI
ncbi:MAG: hypothetical protein ACD_7C00166G0004 [uncultured bacterium]|nr:MAG: hypothetical protein ACD_7C00166G0004 [uncultured bacterium]HBR79814.1 hypothetical protein [Candidatus Moranbacteria bacterium]